MSALPLRFTSFARCGVCVFLYCKVLAVAPRFGLIRNFDCDQENNSLGPVLEV